jgi:queuosine precursor transporter
MEHDTDLMELNGPLTHGPDTWRSSRWSQYSMVAMYLAAIVAANLLVAWFGPAMSIINAFLFIGLDLTSRDRLHDAWHGRGLVWKMAALIAVGSLLSWLLNRDAGQIALASFLAFAAAAIVDTLAYHLLRNRPWWQRVNGSNIASAAVDSLIFPTVAFGALLPAIVLGQFAAKVLGGMVWG